MQPPRQPARKLPFGLLLEMVHPVIPFDGLILGRRRVKDRDVVVVGQPVFVVGVRRVPAFHHFRIPARFEHEHFSAALRKARRDAAATCAGADDHIFKRAVGCHETSPLVVPDRLAFRLARGVGPRWLRSEAGHGVGRT